VPWHVPAAWFERFPPDGLRLPPYRADDFDDIPECSRRVNDLPAMPTTEWAIATDEWRNTIQAYLACTAFVDHQIGRVLRALAESPVDLYPTVLEFCNLPPRRPAPDRIAQPAGGSSSAARREETVG
jgi:hypothetical protein